MTIDQMSEPRKRAGWAGLVLLVPRSAAFGAAHYCDAESREAPDRIAKANLKLSF